MDFRKTLAALILSPLILFNSAFAGVLSIGVKNQNSKTSASADFQQAKTFVHIGSDSGTLESAIDSEIIGLAPLFYIRNGTIKNSSGSIISNEDISDYMAGLGYNLNFSDSLKSNISAFAINNSHKTTETETMKSSEHFIDTNYDYTINVTANSIANANCNSSLQGAYIDFGSDKLKLFGNYLGGTNELTGNVHIDIETIISGTIAGTPVYDVSTSSGNIPLSTKQDISQTSLGISYQFSGPFVLTANLYTSNNSVKASARAVFKTGFYGCLDDISKSELEINKYIYSGVYNNTRENRIKLAEKSGYDNAVVISVNTDNKASIAYNGEDFRIGAAYDNGNISASTGYKGINFEATKTNTDKMNYSASYTLEF